MPRPLSRPLAMLAFASALVLPLGAAPVAAETGAATLASTDSNTPGVVAEVVECKRKDGVLTLKIRFRNSGTAKARLELIDGRNYDVYYLTAGSKKYFILRDAEKAPLAPAAGVGGDFRVELPANGTYTWWAKYPAPPAEVKSVNVYTPVTPPMDDVPISDP